MKATVNGPGCVKALAGIVKDNTTMPPGVEEWGAVESLAAYAPDQAIYVADLFGVGRDNGYLEHLVQMWAEASLADAERWLAGQPDDARTAPLRARIEQVRDQRRASGRG